MILDIQIYHSLFLSLIVQSCWKLKNWPPINHNSIKYKLNSNINFITRTQVSSFIVTKGFTTFWQVAFVSPSVNYNYKNNILMKKLQWAKNDYNDNDKNKTKTKKNRNKMSTKMMTHMKHLTVRWINRGTI